MNRIKQVISVAIAVTLSITTLKLDKVEANPITAPECRDVPSCIVIGTVIIGGVVYYLIKNTVTGVVRRVPAGQIPAHRTHKSVEDVLNEPPGDKDTIEVPGLHSREQCQRFAEEYQRRHGGRWTGRTARVGIPSPGTEDIPSRPVFKCAITREPRE